jgi:hypothetical protein
MVNEIIDSVVGGGGGYGGPSFMLVTCEILSACSVFFSKITGRPSAWIAVIELLGSISAHCINVPRSARAKLTLWNH